MSTIRSGLRAAAKFLFLVIAAPLLLVAVFVTLLASHWPSPSRRRNDRKDRAPRTGAVSVVIPTWNGKEHLAANLPSVVTALSGDPEHEIIVVDNGSADGTSEFLHREFPSVRVLALEGNLGFGGGSNTGFEAARNAIVVLLNNDMRVEPDFLEPLLEGFGDPRVFAVTSQIFLADPAKRREETGLTHGEWINGRLRVRHVEDDSIPGLFPTFYAGGGSTAFDRAKFLELGGFDSLLAPFYLEDTDISYMAWKRGWVCLYQPRSVVHHVHRGTIGKSFSEFEIDAVLKKNHLLFAWKNIHGWRRLAAHLAWLYAGLWLHALLGATPLRPSLQSFFRAVRQLPQAFRRRRAAKGLATISDKEALRRPLGGYFHDRFGEPFKAGERLRVLFVSPYPFEPPLHGGAVFMNQTVRELARHCDVHLICMLDSTRELDTHRSLEKICASTEFTIREQYRGGELGALRPHAVHEFFSSDLRWRIHRTICREKIDVIQLEYTHMAAYGESFDRIAAFLFEHDIYFQSVLRLAKQLKNPKEWLTHYYEYLRALRFEREALRAFDAVQVCTAESRRHLESHLWDGPPILDGLRAGIDTGRYSYVEQAREPDTLLFVGSFRHLPNRQAMKFFLEKIWPRVRRRRPQARLVAAGSHSEPGFQPVLEQAGVEYLGRVDNLLGLLHRCSVFICPILTGSGVRVKLLEAFAAGIPAVSTSLGAEGLLDGNKEIAAIADTPQQFASETVRLLEDSDRRRSLARAARQEVVQNWDVHVITERLARSYQQFAAAKAGRTRPEPPLRWGIAEPSSRFASPAHQGEKVDTAAY